MVDKSKKDKPNPKKPLPLIQPQKDQSSGKPKNQPEDSGLGVSLDDDLNFEEGSGLKGVDTELKLGGSGSEAGLLDLNLQADDTTLGRVIDELYQEEGFPSLDETPKKPKNYKVFRYDEAMAKHGWKRHNRIYHDKYIAIAFVQKKSSPTTKAYVMLGYGFEKFLKKPESLKSLDCRVGERSMSLHDLIRKIKSTYLKVEGRKPFARVYDRGNARIALGYSVVYDPSTNIDEQIKAISNTAQELNEDIIDTLNQALAYTEKGEVGYISGLDVILMYREAHKGQIMEEQVLVPKAEQPDALSEGIQAAAVDYAGQQAAKRLGVFEKGPSWISRIYGSTIGRLVGRRPKPKQ